MAKSPPDGLTLLMGVNMLIINPALYANMTYDPLKDLAPIGLAGMEIAPSLPEEMTTLMRRDAAR